MKLIYVAGPYIASTPWLEEQNIRAAEALAYEVAKCGAMPLCPHSNTRSYFDAAQPRAFWLAGTLEMLKRCDGAIFVPGWLKSQGARDERHYCLTASPPLPVFDSVSELHTWLELIGERVA